MAPVRDSESAPSPFCSQDPLPPHEPRARRGISASRDAPGPASEPARVAGRPATPPPRARAPLMATCECGDRAGAPRFIQQRRAARNPPRAHSRAPPSFRASPYPAGWHHSMPQTKPDRRLRRKRRLAGRLEGAKAKRVRDGTPSAARRSARATPEPRFPAARPPPARPSARLAPPPHHHRSRAFWKPGAEDGGGGGPCGDARRSSALERIASHRAEARGARCAREERRAKRRGSPAEARRPIVLIARRGARRAARVPFGRWAGRGRDRRQGVGAEPAPATCARRETMQKMQIPAAPTDLRIQGSPQAASGCPAETMRRSARAAPTGWRAATDGQGAGRGEGEGGKGMEGSVGQGGLGRGGSALPGTPTPISAFSRSVESAARTRVAALGRREIQRACSLKGARGFTCVERARCGGGRELGPGARVGRSRARGGARARAAGPEDVTCCRSVVWGDG